MVQVTEADKYKAQEIVDEASKCCNDLPCRTLSGLIAKALAVERWVGGVGLERATIWRCPQCGCLYSRQVSECYRCAEARKAQGK